MMDRFLRLTLTRGRYWRYTWLWLGRLRRPDISHPVTPVTAVRLGYVTVVHAFHLPAGEVPKNTVAMPATRAARMARSSLFIRRS